MKTFVSVFAAAAVLSSMASGASVERRANTVSNSNTPPVSVKGNAFFAGNKRFYVRGVDYQPGGSSANEDPISEPNVCKRDIAKFKQLGINTVRVYSADNSANHDDCMKQLADAGIYLAVDVNTPFYSLNRNSEKDIHISYNEVYLQSVFSTVEAFAKYDNTLLFFSGNEVINNSVTTFAAPYIKAVTRDIKSYLKARGYRPIPVGYSAADVADNRYETAVYMNCGSDDTRSDFFAFNDYSWCSPSSYQTSGWDQKVKQYSSYGLPLFLSEYGCNTNKRDFGEVAALYGSDMTPVYSGGLVYEYSQEPSNYGLVTISGNSIEDRPDFAALASALKQTPAPSGDGGYKSANQASTCPPQSKTWLVTNSSLPDMPAGAANFMKSGAGTPPGNKGDTGSQTSGTPSSGWGDGGSSSGSSGSKPGKNSADAAVRPGVAMMVLATVFAVAAQQFLPSI